MKTMHIILGAALVAALIVIGWLIWASEATDIAAYWLDADAPQTAGSWGDSFGPFNALFASLGFAAVLATLLIQARALRTQQDDLHRQKFESSFFQLLTLLREVRSELRFNYSKQFLTAIDDPPTDNSIKTGKEAILYAVREIRFWIVAHGTEHPFSREELAGIYEKHVHTRYESDFGPYFRLIYTVLDRIRSDRVLNEDEKVMYANLLRSQLESHEVFLLGVNGLSGVSRDLATLIEKFRMLKYLPTGVRRSTLERHYSAHSFEARDEMQHSSLTDSSAEETPREKAAEAAAAEPAK